MKILYDKINGNSFYLNEPKGGTMEKRDYQILKNQKGFTLIEIIAVLVIMGILAAVAVPKFFDLAGEAEIKAYKAAGAEIQARINQNFAQNLLSSNYTDCDSAIGGISDTNVFHGLGESFSASSNDLTATAGTTQTITIDNGEFNDTSYTYTITMPDCVAAP